MGTILEDGHDLSASLVEGERCPPWGKASTGDLAAPIEHEQTMVCLPLREPLGRWLRGYPQTVCGIHVHRRHLLSRGSREDVLTYLPRARIELMEPRPAIRGEPDATRAIGDDGLRGDGLGGAGRAKRVGVAAERVGGGVEAIEPSRCADPERARGVHVQGQDRGGAQAGRGLAGRDGTTRNHTRPSGPAH